MKKSTVTAIIVTLIVALVAFLVITFVNSYNEGKNDPLFKKIDSVLDEVEQSNAEIDKQLADLYAQRGNW